MKYTLIDGCEVDLTLNYGFLYLLQKENSEVYAEFDDAKRRWQKGNLDEFDMFLDPPKIIYAAYYCDCKFSKKEEPIGLIDFLTLMPMDVAGSSEIMTELIGIKKKTGLEGHLKKQPKTTEKA